MKVQNLELDEKQQVLIMKLWALSADIARSVPIRKRQQVEGLEEALEIISNFPASLGWGEAPTPSDIEYEKRLDSFWQGLPRLPERLS